MHERKKTVVLLDSVKAKCSNQIINVLQNQKQNKGRLPMKCSHILRQQNVKLSTIAYTKSVLTNMKDRQLESSLYLIDYCTIKHRIQCKGDWRGREKEREEVISLQNY